MNVGKLIYGIIGLIITLLIMSGGLSGQYVLRGTDSSSALVGVMFIFLLLDLFYIYSAIKEGEGGINSTKQIITSTSGMGIGKTSSEFANDGKSSLELDNVATIQEN